MGSYGDASPLTAAMLAERALVGALIWEPDRAHDISAWLEPEDFESPLDGRLYEAVTAMVAQARTDRLVFELPDALAHGRYSDPTRPQAHAWAGDWAVAIHERLAATPASPPPPPDENVPGLGRVEGITADNSKNSEHVRWAQYVLEASTRRAVADVGSQIEYMGTEASEIDISPATVLETLERATARLEELAHRLSTARDSSISRALVEPRSRNNVANPGLSPTRAGLPDLAAKLTPRQLHRAELETLAGAITIPPLRADLVGRLVPADFSDDTVGATWAAVVALHRRGEPVDYVAVAWRAERAAPAEGQPIPMQQLAKMGTAGPRSGEAYVGSELVARAAMLRYTAHAGRDVQQTAQFSTRSARNVAEAATESISAAGKQVRRLHSLETGRRVGVSALDAGTVPTPRPPSGCSSQQNEEPSSPTAGAARTAAATPPDAKATRPPRR